MMGDAGAAGTSAGADALGAGGVEGMDRGTVYGIRVLELQRQFEEMKGQLLKKEQQLFEERRRLHDLASKTTAHSFRAAKLRGAGGAGGVEGASR